MTDSAVAMLSAALLFVAASAASAAAPVVACADLAAPGRFADTTVQSARLVSANSGAGLPEHCQVVGVISPVPGSRIGVAYRLPTDWNGKMLGLGGGGFVGAIRPRAARPGLSLGYATAQTDTGHTGADGTDASWALTAPGALNEVAVVDYAWRGTERMTAVGKQVIAAYYGRPQRYAYWQGCSTGGRQGLVFVQRFPDAYDGVVAGAPVLDFSGVQLAAIWQVQALHKVPGRNLRPDHLPLITKAVLDACDGLDGLADGILDDPARCAWDPGALLCASGPGPSCLTPHQVEAVRAIYGGPRTSAGALLYPPHNRGGEASGWQRFMVGGPPRSPTGASGAISESFLRHMVRLDPTASILDFDFDTDVAAVVGSFAARELDAVETDITPFIDAGGKLIIYHGGVDSAFTPRRTIDYYDDLVAASGPNVNLPGSALARIQAHARLFIVPGMDHCRGGPGPNSFNVLKALEHWVERDQAPDRIVATNRRRGISRPLCPYPRVARHVGSGDTDDEANFDCVEPTDPRAGSGEEK